MTINNEYGLAELHEKLLQALATLDCICREHNIHYALHGGALLGAERNHHLIPWDDDIDIAMRREEYEKLKKVIQESKIPKRFYLDEATVWFPRFIMTTQESLVYIDIFIWDFISENRIARWMKVTFLRAVQGMLKENVNYSQYSFMERFLVGVTQGIGKFFSKEKKLAIYHKIQTKKFIGKKQYIHRSNDSYRGCAYILDNKYMDQYAEIELEGRHYMVNKRYCEFLVMEYGIDYLTLPPEKDRIPRHTQIRECLKVQKK